MEPPTVQKNKTECKMTFRNEEPHVNKCFPRMRGDVPPVGVVGGGGFGFSPHARGCSVSKLLQSGQFGVFPACAGMFLLVPISRVNRPCFPRMRGDVPDRLEGKTDAG